MCISKESWYLFTIYEAWAVIVGPRVIWSGRHACLSRVSLFIYFAHTRSLLSCRLHHSWHWGREHLIRYLLVLSYLTSFTSTHHLCLGNIELSTSSFLTLRTTHHLCLDSSVTTSGKRIGVMWLIAIPFNLPRMNFKTRASGVCGVIGVKLSDWTVLQNYNYD